MIDVLAAVWTVSVINIWGDALTIGMRVDMRIGASAGATIGVIRDIDAELLTDANVNVLAALMTALGFDKPVSGEDSMSF